jgi:hypothetical protein
VHIKLKFLDCCIRLKKLVLEAFVLIYVGYMAGEEVEKTESSQRFIPAHSCKDAHAVAPELPVSNCDCGEPVHMF